MSEMEHSAGYRELIAYGIAGLFTTIVNYVVYGVLTVFYGLDINVSNIIAWTISVFVAFFSNKVFVFQKRDWTLKKVFHEGLLFVGSRLFSGIVGIGLVPILMWLGFTQSIWGIPGLAAKFLAMLAEWLLSYILGKHLVFK